MIKCITRQTADNSLKHLQPFRIPPMQPLDAGARGVAMQVYIPSAQTDYQYTCAETAVAPKTMGPSPHFHKDLDEISLVWEGTLTVMVGDDVYEVPEGSMQMRPRGIVHTFWNATDKPVRFLDMFLNQNFDDYLTEFFKIIDEMEKAQQGVKVPASARRDANSEFAKQLAELDREFGITQFPERRQEILNQYGLER